MTAPQTPSTLIALQAPSGAPGRSLLAIVGTAMAFACRRDSAPNVRADQPAPSVASAASVQPSASAKPVVSMGPKLSCPPDMALVPGDAESGHKPLCVERTEVTVASFEPCISAGKCKAPDGVKDHFRCNRGDKARENHPINCIDQATAAAYCTWRARRLPTDEEWTWAAHGGPRRLKYPWGTEALHERVCYRAHRTGDGSCEVGTYPSGRSVDGIDDLMGNVGEWSATVRTDSACKELCCRSWGGVFSDDDEFVQARFASGGQAACGAATFGNGVRCVAEPTAEKAQ